MRQLSEYRRTNGATTTEEPGRKKERRIRARSSAVTGHAEEDLNRLKIPPTHSIEFDEQQSDIPALDSAGRALSHR